MKLDQRRYFRDLACQFEDQFFSEDYNSRRAIQNNIVAEKSGVGRIIVNIRHRNRGNLPGDEPDLL